MTPNFRHETTYRYSDKSGKRRTATARVFCPLGLSPKDECILWGLLGLTLAIPDSGGELHATRHYCMKHLGMIDSKSKRGGRQYKDFTAAIERISTVKYVCDAFYDPRLAEHCRINFGFFSYRLPLEEDSSRAWRFVWDPLFFEIATAAGGFLRFDLNMYRQLDTASFRLFLFLSKLYFRKSMHISPRLNLIDIAEQIIGIAPSVDARRKKAKVIKCLERLKEHQVIKNARVRRLGTHRFEIRAVRGAYFDRPVTEHPVESPLREPLLELGFEAAAANRLLKRYELRCIRDWLDVTLAKKEREGSGAFRKGAPAYLTDNLKHAAAGRRSFPDWWQKLKKEEELSANGRTGTRKPETMGNVVQAILQPFIAAKHEKK